MLYLKDILLLFADFEDRLNRNKETRIPDTVVKLENLYKLLDRNNQLQNQLLDDMDFWGPNIMAQERKLRLLNKMWEENTESCGVKEVRNIGRHVGKLLT